MPTTIEQLQRHVTCSASGHKCTTKKCSYWKRVIMVDMDGVAYAGFPLGFCGACNK